MVLDTSLLNTQHYKVRIKGKVEKSLEKEYRPPLHLGVVAIEKGAFGSPSMTVAKFTLLIWFQIPIPIFCTQLYDFKYSYLIQITCIAILF